MPMTNLCAHCAEGARGEAGHANLSFYVAGPYPGHRIFKCMACDERWIRHHGGDQPYGWTRYTTQFGPGSRGRGDRIRPAPGPRARPVPAANGSATSAS
jgi:hypothetical protein